MIPRPIFEKRIVNNTSLSLLLLGKKRERERNQEYGNTHLLINPYEGLSPTTPQ